MEGNLVDIIETHCIKGQCILETNGDLSKIIAGHSPVMLDVILQLLQNPTAFSNHYHHLPCLIAVLSKELKRTINVFGDLETNKKMLTSICQELCRLPSLHFPLKRKESDKVFELNKDLNSKMTYQCMHMHLCILLLYDNYCDFDEHKLENMELPVPNMVQKYIIKKTSADILVLTSSRLGNFSWTNKKLRGLCYCINQIICHFSQHPSVVSLLSGVENMDTEKEIHSSGLLGQVLEKLSTGFYKDIYMSNIPWKHAVIWCVTKVKFPHLGAYIPRIVPLLLLLVDDYQTDNKVFGMSTLMYLINNVNPSELNIYNHGRVIYDALFNQLYSNKDIIYNVALPCLLKILCVVEDKPERLEGVTFTLWDACVEKIIQNIEFSNQIKTRRILLQNLPPFLNAMRINIVKHVSAIFKATTFVLLLPDTEKEDARILALDVMHSTIRNGWPVIPRYQKMICKCIIKFMIEVKMSELYPKDLFEKLISAASRVLVLLRECCGETFDNQLKDALEQCDKSSVVGAFIHDSLTNILVVENSKT